MANRPAPSELSQNVAVLRAGTREFCLGAGRYIIGRAPASDIVVNTPLASRQHARLTVNTQAVTVEDLGSVNGVTVNGRRLRAVQALRPGDRVGIGREEIELLEFGLAPELECTQVGNYPTFDPREPGAVVESGTYRSAKQDEEAAEGFALVGGMADRALTSRRPNDAVNILRYRLTGILDEVKRGHTLPRGVRDIALDYAFKLAQATYDGRWVEYALELLICQGMPCPEKFSEAFQLAALSVTGFDRQLLDRYVRNLRAHAPSLERIRALQHAESLRRNILERRGV